MATKFIKKQSAVVGEEYTKDGETKKSWKNLGELLTFETDGREWQKLKLNMFPNLDISIFDDKPREDKKEPVHQKEEIPTIQQDGGKDIKDLPF